MNPFIFRRADVLALNFNKLSKDDLPHTLLCLALKGAGRKNPEEEADRLLESRPPNLYGRLLDAATAAYQRQKRMFLRHNREYQAWRAGYYIACALGAQNQYPPRP
ncbi:MAG: hypothetical protein ACOX6G_10440 [Christensenellales bacterium]|jgi:hypothetical protein